MSTEWERGFAEGFKRGAEFFQYGTGTSAPRREAAQVLSSGAVKGSKPKRKPSAYNKRYSAAFKKVAHRYKTKGGKWKKDGFKRAAAAARKIAKK